MTTIGILGAGQAGVVLARAALGAGYDVVIANSRDPRTLHGIAADLGPGVRAAWAADAAATADVAITAFPYAPHHVLPAAELAGKIVLDNNNYMVWRDGHFPDVDAGRTTVHELRQAQLPASLLAKAFSHIQFHARSPIRMPSDALPGLVRLARPAGAPDRVALSVASDHAEAIAFVTRLYEEFGFDTVEAGPLRESWRTAPGTPVWARSVDGQRRDELIRNLRLAVPPS